MNYRYLGAGPLAAAVQLPAMADEVSGNPTSCQRLQAQLDARGI